MLDIRLYRFYIPRFVRGFLATSEKLRVFQHLIKLVIREGFQLSKDCGTLFVSK